MIFRAADGTPTGCRPLTSVCQPAIRTGVRGPCDWSSAGGESLRLLICTLSLSSKHASLWQCLGFHEDQGTLGNILKSAKMETI